MRTNTKGEIYRMIITRWMHCLLSSDFPPFILSYSPTKNWKCPQFIFQKSGHNQSVYPLVNPPIHQFIFFFICPSKLVNFCCFNLISQCFQWEGDWQQECYESHRSLCPLSKRLSSLMLRSWQSICQLFHTLSSRLQLEERNSLLWFKSHPEGWTHFSASRLKRLLIFFKIHGFTKTYSNHQMFIWRTNTFQNWQ